MKQPILELEGTWEEIRSHDAELAGHKVRLTVLDVQSNGQEQPALSPAQRFAAAMRKAEETERDMPFTTGGDTLEIIRQGRSGDMYGYDPCE